MDGYEAMGFDVTQLTQDMEQSLFTIRTNMPIPVLVYGDAFQWAKYGHHILPSNLDLTSHIKTGIYQSFWNSLIEFLCKDLENSTTIKSRFDKPKQSWSPSNFSQVVGMFDCWLARHSALQMERERAPMIG